MAGAKLADDVSYTDRPTTILIFDSDSAHDRALPAIDAAGFRLVGGIPLEKAMDRLDRQAGADAVYLELDTDGGDILDGLLSRLNRAAEEGEYGVVVSVPPALIDIASRQVSHGEVALLSGASVMDRVAALRLVVERPTSRLHDLDADSGALRLRQLSEEVARIASTLASMSANDGLRRPALPRPEPQAEDGEEAVTADHIRAIIRSRRLRTQLFDMELFSDPAWDMLLDLMAARLERKPVAVSSLCIAAAVPPTTALRWIKMMTDCGLFVRRADPHDGRRIFITLSEEAASAMERYMQQTRRLMREVF